jgi:hypothetical protein
MSKKAVNVTCVVILVLLGFVWGGVKIGFTNLIGGLCGLIVTVLGGFLYYTRWSAGDSTLANAKGSKGYGNYNRTMWAIVGLLLLCFLVLVVFNNR